MLAFFAACTSGGARSAACNGPATGCALTPRSACTPSALARRRLLLSAQEGVEDDEEAAMEAWLKKSNSSRLTGWLWDHSRFFRLELGPRLLSYYRSHIWQSCRREGAYDLTCLVGVQVVRPSRRGRAPCLLLEFVQALEDDDHDIDESVPLPLKKDGVEVVKLGIVRGGEDAAMDWARHLRKCIEDFLLESCAQCGASDAATRNACRLLRHVQAAVAAGCSDIGIDRRRCAGSTLGPTALMLAAEAGNERVCAQLLRARATVHVQDAEGRTAVDIAQTAGHSKVVKLLQGGVDDIVPGGTLLGASCHAHGIHAQELERVPTPARV